MWDRIESFASKRRGSCDTIAIAWYKGSLFVGRNSHKTSPKFRRNFPDKESSYARHAEMDLLSRLPISGDCQDVQIYVMRWRKDGKMSMARPCSDCYKRLRAAKFLDKNIHFINWSGDWARMSDSV